MGLGPLIARVEESQRLQQPFAMNWIARRLDLAKQARSAASEHRLLRSHLDGGSGLGAQ
jgi:hypothetical protein